MATGTVEGNTEVRIKIGDKEFLLYKQNPIPLEDEELVHHLYHLSSVFMRFFSDYTEKFVTDLLSSAKTPRATYSEALSEIDKLVNSFDIKDTLTRYEVLFQYRHLLRQMEKIKFGSMESMESITKKVKEEIAEHFNQARTTQHITFLNVVSTYRRRIPDSLRLAFILNPRRVAVHSVKYGMREMNKGAQSHLVYYDAPTHMDAIDTVLAIRQGLDAYVHMPLHQEW